MARWVPDLYRMAMSMRVVNGAPLLSRWQNALASALANHPVFSTEINRHGQRYKAPDDILKGKYHHIILQTNGPDLEIHGQISRILGDGTSLAILMDDIRRAYNGEPLARDDYFGYLDYFEQYKQSQRYRDSKSWLEQEFADTAVPVHPTPDRSLWSLFPPKVGVFTDDYSARHKTINRFTKSQVLSMEGFLSLCAALAIAEYCGTDAAALTWAYEGRERPEEQRVYGSLHKDVPFQLQRSDNRDELIKNARNQIRSGIAHSDYPYTLTAPYNKRWNYAVNVLRVEDEHALIKLLPQPVELLPTPPQKIAYALLDVEIHESFENLSIVYRYSATHYKESSIRRFAALVRKYAEWLLEE